MITINDFFHATYSQSAKRILTPRDVLARPLKVTFIEFEDGQINMNRVTASNQLFIDGIQVKPFYTSQDQKDDSKTLLIILIMIMFLVLLSVVLFFIRKLSLKQFRGNKECSAEQTITT